ncbi:MAG: hypothetical protein ACOYXT_10525, partial [Bacteroidota bacterium]
WRLPTFLFIIAYPVNLFVLARLLFPFALKKKAIDLKSFYYNSYRKIFVVFSVSAFLSIAYNLFIIDMQAFTQILQLLLAVAFVTIVTKRITYEWAHKGLVLIVFSIFVISVIIEWNVWLID